MTVSIPRDTTQLSFDTRGARALESYPTWVFQIEKANSFAEITYEDPAEFWHSTGCHGCILRPMRNVAKKALA